MAIAIGFKGSFVTALDNVPDPPIFLSILPINCALSEFCFSDSCSISLVSTTNGFCVTYCISVVLEESVRHIFTPLLTHDSILQQLQFLMSKFSLSMDSFQIASQSISNNFSTALSNSMIKDFAIFNAQLGTTFHRTFTPLLVTRCPFQSFSLEKLLFMSSLCMSMPAFLEHIAINNHFIVAARSVLLFETSVHHLLTPPLVPLFKNILQTAFVSSVLLSLALSIASQSPKELLHRFSSIALLPKPHFLPLSLSLIYILLTPLLMYCVLILCRQSVPFLLQLHSLSSGCHFPVRVCL